MRRRRRREQEKLFIEISSPDFLKALTWTCHICKETRPDAKISVLTKRVEELSITTGSEVTENIRYCNDKPECIAAAKTYSHFHLHGEEE